MISVLVPHLAIVFLCYHNLVLVSLCCELLCRGSVVSCAVDPLADPSCLSLVDLLADPPCVSLVDLLADLLFEDLISLPLNNMVSPLPKCSMHLWTAS